MVGLVFLPLAAALAGLGGCSTKYSDADIVRIELPAARELASREGTVLVDPRPWSVYSAGHLPGARRVVASEIVGPNGERVPALRGYSFYVVYAQNPGDLAGQSMAKSLMKAGYEKVRLFEGGFDAWVRAGYRVERGADGPR